MATANPSTRPGLHGVSAAVTDMTDMANIADMTALNAINAIGLKAHRPYKYPQTDSGNTSNTSSTSATSTNTCASSVEEPAKNLTVSATGSDFTAQQPQKPDQLLFTKKAIIRSRPSSNQISTLVASTVSTASRTSSISSLPAQELPSSNQTTPCSSLRIGAQFPFKSTNHITSVAPPPAAATVFMDRSPEKAKRLTSESVLPSLCTRAPSVKLLGLHRTASTIDTTSRFKSQYQLRNTEHTETVSLPASPTAKDSLLPSLARRNGSSTSLASVGTMVQLPRQLNSPKTPLYVPSVLRRTRTTTALPSLSTPQSPSPARLGTPSRAHWTPDRQRSCCAACDAHFTLFTRRHHCRKCGDVFCERDSGYAVKLDKSCQYHHLGVTSRACAGCYAGWESFLDETHVAVDDSLDLLDTEGSVSDDAESVRSTSDSTPVLAPSTTTPSVSLDSDDALLDTVVGSVPANWSWSTF